MAVSALTLNEVVLLNLNCLEQGIISKSVAHEGILRTVASNMISVLNQHQAEENDIALLQTLHDQLGLAVVIHNGVITDVTFEPCIFKKGA